MLVAQVLYRKRSGGKDYVVADAGMTELLRPSHYGAFHRIVAMRRARRRRARSTSSDRCARAATFSRSTASSTTCSRATISWSCDVGAYGYAMASNYNSRCAPAEVLVDGDRLRHHHGARRRTTISRGSRSPQPEWKTRRSADADRTDRGHARSPSGHRRAGAADAGRRASGWCCTPATIARRSRSRAFEEAHVSLAGVFGRNDGDPQGLVSRAQSAFGIELFESPHSFEIGGRRILLVHDIGDVHERSVASHEIVDSRPHASAGDEDARRDADRESGRGVRLALRHAVGGAARPRHARRCEFLDAVRRRVEIADALRLTNRHRLSRILIIDYGSQFTQLIARRVREARVYSEIHPPTRSVEWIRDWKPTGIILSGGPNSVYEDGAPTADPGDRSTSRRCSAICYGMQLVAHVSGGEVIGAGRREYGRAELQRRRDVRPVRRLQPSTRR